MAAQDDYNVTKLAKLNNFTYQIIVDWFMASWVFVNIASDNGLIGAGCVLM